MTTIKSHKTSVLPYLWLLTGFFLLLEISFFIQCNKMYFADFLSVSDSFHLPLSILPGIIFFVVAEISLHILFTLFVWLQAITLCAKLPISSFYLAIGCWLMGLIFILLLNQYYFPHSKFSEITSILFWDQRIVLGALSILFLAEALVTGYLCLAIMRAISNKTKDLLLLVSSTLLVIWYWPITTQDGATEAQPNIILVGVDSLRPDFLHYFGRDIHTPFLDELLTTSLVFNKALTPLARTFPSWTSILTGEHPKQHGVRTNLTAFQDIHLTTALPKLLQAQGYETAFATDETRFSNIDQHFGFDHVITPPIGLNDFLIGTLNDFPFSNLLVNTLIGKWLFPYSYANRPVYVTYEPLSFIHLMNDQLPSKRNKPLFLAVHFCLAHFPYDWRDSPADEKVVKRYEKSLEKIDEQLKAFFALLKKRQLLNHTIVVLLSDHGEALELSGDRITNEKLFVGSIDHATPPKFYPPSLEEEGMNQSAGHGTDVLGLSQYYSLLAFKLYGKTQTQGIKTQIVSLLDIKPTLLDLLKIKHAPLPGLSLATFLHSKANSFAPRHLFFESDFSPQAIRTVYPQTHQVVLEGAKLFDVNFKSTRLTIRADMKQMIIDSKQYADLYGDWVLAIYPQENKRAIPILTHLPSGKWTNDLQSPFAQQSPASLMLNQLKMFYGNEISAVY